MKTDKIFKVLDLYCGGGGSAMGYHQALNEADIKHEITGVDINQMPRYPFNFVQGDALEYIKEYGWMYDFIHASPPCQGYANVTRWKGNQSNHPKLIPQTRELLDGTGKPYVIENVRTQELNSNLVLCGSLFRLRIIRHRYFEIPWMTSILTISCNHNNVLPFMHKGEREYTDAMGCYWMSNLEGRQAIPPAYTRFIMNQYLAMSC